MEQILAIFNPWWDRSFKAGGIEREGYIAELERRERTKDIVFVVGLRRVGKTTLMHQYIEHLIKRGNDPRRILYFSMDHPALARESILDTLDAYRRAHGFKHDDRFTVIIDEAHLREGFEQELKAIYDLGRVKVFATGSSSLSLVERGSNLIGRQSFMEVFPFGFQEYLGIKRLKFRQSDSHLMVRYAEDYVRSGGLPEYLKTGDPNYVTTMMDAVLYKDIAARRGVRNMVALRELLLIITQSTGSKVSPRKIGRTLGISHETVREHLSQFEESNLIHTVRYDGKVSESMASPRKLYLSDTGVAHVLSPTINLGSLVENCVFNALRSRGGEIKYGIVRGSEVDFILRDSCYEVKYSDNVASEEVAHLRGVDVRSRTVVTKGKSGHSNGIDFVPLWRFLTDWQK